MSEWVEHKNIMPDSESGVPQRSLQPCGAHAGARSNCDEPTKPTTSVEFDYHSVPIVASGPRRLCRLARPHYGRGRRACRQPATV